MNWISQYITFSVYVFRSEFLRGIFMTDFSVPPSKAKRRALSRSIKALRPAHTRSVLFFKPESSTALVKSSSSMFKVVRIVTLIGYRHGYQYKPTLMNIEKNKRQESLLLQKLKTNTPKHKEGEQP